MELPEEVLKALCEVWPVARLASVSAEAQPHLVPIVFCEREGVIYSPVDGKRKSGSRLQRLANLQGNPNAALLLDDYTSDWQALWWVRVDATADLFEPVGTEGREIAHCLLEKYPQYQDPSLRFDPSLYLRFRPVNVTAWSQSGSMASIVTAIAH